MIIPDLILVENILKMKMMQLIKWLVYSPDRNQIKHTCDTIRQCTAIRQMPPLLPRTLKLYFLKSRTEFSKILLTTSSNFMKNKCVKSQLLRVPHSILKFLTNLNNTFFLFTNIQIGAFEHLILILTSIQRI